MTPERLATEVNQELAHLRAIADLAKQIQAYKSLVNQAIASAAAAKVCSDLFQGLENLCKRRLRYLGLPLLQGEDSHRQYLDGFLADPGLGGTLEQATKERLQNYRRLRHRMIHGYATELSWELLEEPLALLPETVEALARAWEQWLKGQASS